MSDDTDDHAALVAQSGTTGRQLIGWIWSALLIGVGSVMAVHSTSWLNDRVAGAIYVVGGLLIVPPVLSRLRLRFAITRSSALPLAIGLGTVPLALVLAVPFEPSASEQSRLRLIAIEQAEMHLAEGDLSAAKSALYKFENLKKNDPKVRSVFNRIKLARQARQGGDRKTKNERKSAFAPTATPKQAPIQDAASAYTERVETYWIPKAKGLSFDPASGEDAIGKLQTNFELLSQIVADGSNLTLDDKQAASRKKLMGLLSAKQVKIFPELRKRYAEALDAKLFRRDIRASSHGSTLSLVGDIFVFNANVQDMQTALTPAILRLRFRRTEYRWNARLGDSLIYSHSPPADAELAVLNGGNFVPVRER